MPTTPAALKTAARRLRYLRRRPAERYARSYTEAECNAASFAYEHALRILIDEFSAEPEFHALFYGPLSEQATGGYPG
jgi:hypothetical protein